MTTDSTADAAPLLEMRGICKHFPGVQALKSVDFDLRPGEVHILVGENGAGKSTLAKVLSGAYTADEGEVILDGAPVRFHSPRDALDAGVAMIYQEFNLAQHLTVAENIFLGQEIILEPVFGTVNASAMREKSRGVLQSLHAKVSPDDRLSGIGTAQMQLVEIAKALLVDSRILIMDEPTASLSEQEIEHLFETIGRLKQAGVAIVYISHRLEEFERVGDRVTVMRNGERVWTGGIAEATIPKLIRLMVGREVGELFPKEPVEQGEVLLSVEGFSCGGVVRDVSFEVRRGEILGIAGLVGSGRTTLLRGLFGLEEIHSGRIMVNGREVIPRHPADAIAAGIALVPEDRKTEGLAVDMTLAENVTMASPDRIAGFGWLSHRREDELARHYIGELNVATRGPRQIARTLSGGNQQKVVIAKWLCRQADVLLLDEPARGIDVGSKAEVFRLMVELARDGKAVVMVSSYLPELLGMCDRLMVMFRGIAAATFPVAQATQERVIAYASVGPDAEKAP